MIIVIHDHLVMLIANQFAETNESASSLRVITAARRLRLMGHILSMQDSGNPMRDEGWT